MWTLRSLSPAHTAAAEYPDLMVECRYTRCTVSLLYYALERSIFVCLDVTTMMSLQRQ
jgi:hypothetical protein